MATISFGGLKFVTPGENQGQIVTVSYARACNAIVRRTYDASDRTEVYSVAKLVWPEDDPRWDEWETYEPVNCEPPWSLDWERAEEVNGRLAYPVTKGMVRDWETVATYVATYPSDDVAGACDVSVEIGEAGGLWYLRTTDDAGGSDDCDDTSYATREAAAEAAEAFAAANDEAPDDDDATAYVARLRDEAIGETDPDGEYCVYWSTALEDSGPRERYATAEQAVAAAEKADEELRQKHGSNLLCGFEARVLADGEWVQLDAVRD